MRSRSASTASIVSGLSGGAAGSSALIVAGAHRRHDRTLVQPLVVIGEPVDQAVTETAEFIGSHGASLSLRSAAILHKLEAGWARGMSTRPERLKAGSG